MKAHNFPMSNVFLVGGDIQFVLPIFQREYAWEQEEWQTLLKDILEIYNASDTDKIEHFMGSLVVIPIPERDKPPLFQAYTLVDGQQRLTSISIILCALRDLLPAGNALRIKINRYLLNDGANDVWRYKISPTTKYDDHRTYCALLDGTTIDGSRSRIMDAYAFFHTYLGNLIVSEEVDSQRLFNCILSSLYLVFIVLDSTDKPYKIFESLNHRGKALTQADLVRNYIAMTLPPKRQQEVFDSEWSRIEDKLSDRRETARIPELTAFLRHYLALHLGDLPRTDQVYNRFRDRIERRMNTTDDEFVNEIEKLNRFASHYNKLLRPDNESASKVKEQLKRLNILEPTTAYPLLMYFYDLFERKEIDESDLQKTLEVVENYLVRRFLAGEPTNYHNSMFTSLAHDLMNQNERGASSLEAALGARNYPSDNRLWQRLMWNRLYSTNKSRRIVFVFEAIGLHINSEVKLAKKGTVEHIMPQNPNEEWKAHLGENWQDTHRELLHTIGNLTIVSQPWNTMLSNSLFSIKRSKLLKQDLPLNTQYFSHGPLHWGESEIRKRTKFLAETIVKVWPAFTEPPRSEGVKGKKPLTLTIREQKFAVYTWSGMLMQMVDCLHDLQLLTDLDSAKNEFGGWVGRGGGEYGRHYKESTRDWRIYVNLTAENIVHFCGRLARLCGLDDNEWSFTYE